MNNFNFVCMLELALFFLNKIFGVNVGSCEYTIGYRKLSYLNMIENGKVTYSNISGLENFDGATTYERDICNICNLIKLLLMGYKVENTYSSDGTELIDRKIILKDAIISYSIIDDDNNVYCVAIQSEWCHDIYAITTNPDFIRVVLTSIDGDNEIEVTIDESGCPRSFIVNSGEEFIVTDDPIKYIGSYEPRYVKISTDITCEIELLCNKEENK